MAAIVREPRWRHVVLPMVCGSVFAAVLVVIAVVGLMYEQSDAHVHACHACIGERLRAAADKAAGEDRRGATRAPDRVAT